MADQELIRIGVMHSADTNFKSGILFKILQQIEEKTTQRKIHRISKYMYDRMSICMICKIEENSLFQILQQNKKINFISHIAFLCGTPTS